MARVRTWAAFTLVAVLGSAAAQELPALLPPGAGRLPFLAPRSAAFTVTARLEPSEQAPGHPVVGVVAVTCPQDWYIYADSLSVTLSAPPGTSLPLREGQLRLPPPDPTLPDNHLEGRLVARLVLHLEEDAAPGEYEFELLVGFRGCSEDVCLPVRERRLPLALTVLGPEEQPVAVSLPEEAPPSRPTQAVRYQERLSTGSLLVSVLVAFLAGLGLVFTPCVYPMIPITISLIGAASTERRLSGLGRSLAYVFGISVTYALVGVIAAGTGRAFGTLLQHPAIYLGLAVVFIALAGSMVGLYTIELPPAWTARLQGKLRGRAGLVGIFLLGIVSGVALSPCTAPVIFGAMGYVLKTNDLLAGFLIFFAIAWGMGTPLVVLGTFGGLIRSLPKSGRWQKAVQRIFALGLLGAALYFVWLSGVLPEPWFYMLLAGLLIVAGVFAGAFERLDASSGWWARARKAAGLLLLAGGVAAFVLALSRGLPEGERIQWLTSEPEGRRTAAEQGRPAMLYFWQEYCPACWKLERSSFRHAGVVEESRRFVCVKFDGTDSASSQVRAILERYRVWGFPTIVFVSTGGKVLHGRTIVGYVRAEQLLEAMKAVP